MKLKSGPTTAAALTRRAFKSLRRSLIQLALLEGVSREQIDAVLLPNPHQRPEDRERRASREASTTAGVAPGLEAAATPAPPVKSKKRKILRPYVD